MSNQYPISNKKILTRHLTFDSRHLILDILRGSGVGFTLIETLIVMLILVTVGSIILSIFIIALTGTTKTRSQQVVRENGNYAIAEITRQILYAKTLNYVHVADDTSGENKLDCLVGSMDEDEEPSIKYDEISVNSFDGEETILACTSISEGPNEPVKTIASMSASLATAEDASLVNIKKVQVLDCYFTCKQLRLSETPTIGISLKLSPISNTNNAVLFENSIVPRNF